MKDSEAGSVCKGNDVRERNISYLGFDNPSSERRQILYRMSDILG